MSEKGFVSVDVGAPDSAGRLRTFVAGLACVSCGAQATEARTRRFGVLAIPQGHCGRCARRHQLLALLAIVRMLLGLAATAALAWFLFAWFRERPGPEGPVVLGLVVGFAALGFALEHARAVRVLGIRKRRVLLAFRSKAGARAFLDANGLAQAKVHETLADAIAEGS
jgi:hypothetical protein